MRSEVFIPAPPGVWEVSRWREDDEPVVRPLTGWYGVVGWYGERTDEDARLTPLILGPGGVSPLPWRHPYFNNATLDVIVAETPEEARRLFLSGARIEAEIEAEREKRLGAAS